ncbi:hypothetical protein KAT08_00845 [Candidatus Babeliales bacterium]|nr:hypothetical protein [Candidatus Babeliales bacterium]
MKFSFSLKFLVFIIFFLSFSKDLNSLDIKLYKTLKIPNYSSVTCLEFNPKDSNILLVGCSSGQLLRWNISKTKYDIIYENSQSKVVSLSCKDDLVSIAHSDEYVLFLKINSFEGDIFSLPNTNHNYCFSFNYLNPSFFSRCLYSSNKIEVWEKDGNKLKGYYLLQLKKSNISCLKWHDLYDNNLACGCLNNIIEIWNFKTDKCIFSLAGHFDKILCIFWNPFYPTVLASGSRDNTIRLWNLIKREKCIGILKGHKSSVSCLSFHPSISRILVSGSDDTEIRIWDINILECVNILKQHKSKITCLSFSKKGDFLASGDIAGNIFVWKVII